MEGCVTKEHLLEVARRILFSTQKAWERNLLRCRLVLSRAKEMGCTESAWLLTKFASKKMCLYEHKYVWIVAMMSNENSPRSYYYRGRAKRLLGMGGLKSLMRSAEKGFSPAMIEMSNFGPLEDRDFWLRKAAEHGNPTALFKLGKFFEAAAKGHILSHKILSKDPLLSPVEAARFGARYLLLSMDKDYHPPNVSKHPELCFAMGYELKDHELFWDTYNQPSRHCRRFIRFYKKHAFHALLLAIFELRKHLGRDVANLIGRMAHAMIH
jgi:hypothetical protein